MKTKKIFFSLFIIIFIFLSCKKETPTPQLVPIDSKTVTVLNDLADIEFLIASDFDSKIQSLKTAITNVIAAPNSTNLIAAQNAWKQSRDPWETNEAFAFGPISTMGIDAASDDWPADRTGITAIVNSTTTINDSLIKSLATPSKGFHAVEFLLFGTTGTITVNDFTPRQWQLLNALSFNLKEQSNLLKTSWTRGNNSFVDDFVKAGNGSALYASANDAISEILNSIVDITDELPNAKIQNPLQANDNNLAESPYSNYTLNDYQNNLLSVKTAYLGTYGSAVKNGLSLLIADKNPTLNDKVITQINLCIALGNTFNQPFNVVLNNSQTQLMNWQTEIIKLNKLFDDDVRSALGLSE